MSCVQIILQTRNVGTKPHNHTKYESFLRTHTHTRTHTHAHTRTHTRTQAWYARDIILGRISLPDPATMQAEWKKHRAAEEAIEVGSE